MSTLEILPVVAITLASLAVVFALTGFKLPFGIRLGVLVLLSLVFISFSIVTVTNEGLKWFWSNHTVNLSGNQVWFDLVIAVTLCYYLMLPRARAVNMNVSLWAIAVMTTACIALLPMFARLIWLEQREHETDQGEIQ